MAQVQIIQPYQPQSEELEKVAAYCRVSTDSKDQLNSYRTQIGYYTNFIAQHPGWELADIYADEGITGTSLEKRDEFKRMLAGLACVLAVCLCTPTAFAAKVIIYFDANGGTCTSAAERTNDEGKLGSLPGASMEGYTFDGWYTTGTDDVTGFPIDVQVKANDTAFGADTTVYAHWSANGGSAEVVEEKEVDPDTLLTTMGLAAGSVVLVLLASLAL